MFARMLTCCTIAVLAVAVGCVAYAAWTEFLWVDNLFANLFQVAFPVGAALPALVLTRLGWEARRRWLAAVGILLAAVWVSGVTVYCWAVAEPSGPDGYEVLMLLRSMGVLIAGLLPSLLGVLVAAVVMLLSHRRRAEPVATPDPARN